MTMPNERSRSLGWGAELLDSLAQDPEMPDEARLLAASLRRTHPDAVKLRSHLASGRNGLPAPWVSAIQSAFELFNRSWFSNQGSPNTQRELQAVLRHYPDPTTTALIGDEGIDIRGWLLPEDQYK